ncbi:hypothetical protein COOONC_23887, partial [Cooperia oncophora]
LGWTITEKICRCEKLDKRLEAEGKSINAHRNFELLDEEEKFFALKKTLDDLMENLSLFDFFIDDWNVNWPILRHRVERIMKPVNAVLDFIRSQIEQRKREIANGTHVPQGEGDDFVDAFLIQMKKEHENALPTSFE